MQVDNTSNLEELEKQIASCYECALWQGRTCTVPGDGNPQAEIMFVGEGPGEQEDSQGLPFVGRSGEMLTRTLLDIGLNREDVYIANMVKCRPPGNRNPSPEEVEKCRPYLEKQIELIEPKLIVPLGKVAASYLLGREIKITKERGFIDVLPFNTDILLLIAYHPSYVIRNRKSKVERDFREDLKAARNIVYGESANDELFTGSAG